MFQNRHRRPSREFYAMSILFLRKDFVEFPGDNIGVNDGLSVELHI